MEKVNLLGFFISNCTYHELLEEIKKAIKNRKGIHIVTANAAMLTTAQRDNELKKCLFEADIITADGMSIIWATKFLGYPLKERVTGIDSIWRIIEQAEKFNQKIFLLGSEQSVIEKVVKTIKNKFPNLDLVGYRNGYFEKDEDVIALIKRCQANILLGGMGFSFQEKWICKYKKILNVPVIMGVGGSFDVIAGKLTRAPLWVQKIGMEWFFRLIQEPKRLWKRYLITNTMFIYKVMKTKLTSKG